MISKRINKTLAMAIMGGSGDENIKPKNETLVSQYCILTFKRVFMWVIFPPLQAQIQMPARQINILMRSIFIGPLSFQKSERYNPLPMYE